ncbi:hypothetical protein [Aestuariivirga sp.]|uniref:DUF7507 domain-containing protein n=1 Tax=Aestuariivirga sp. TaxID=2650926 RepID=UPI0039E5A912
MRWLRAIAAVAAIALPVAFAPAAVAAPNCTGTVLNTNGSFETPNKGAAVNWYSEPAANVPGWTTSSTAFEIWANSFNGVVPYQGTQLNEMNWNAADTLTTTAFTVQPRAELRVYWAHRGRSTTETANLQINTAGGATLLNYGDFSTATGAWVLRNATTVMGTSATSVVLRFQAITPGSIGNLFDSVEACQTYITLTKTLFSKVDSNADGRDSAGDTLTYQFAISNPAGNDRSLSAVQVVDDRIGTVTAATYRVSGDTTANNQLDPGETWIVRVPYTVTLANMDAGSVTNTAYAQGNTGANIIRSPDAVLTTPLTRVPGISLAKTAWRGGVQLFPGTRVAVGDAIEFRFQVTNTGNTTVNGIAVAETAFNGNGPAPVPTLVSGSTTLTPGQSAQYAGSYTVTQRDIDTRQ